MIDEEALRSIEKLHQLKQGGIISEAEFDKAKQDILQGNPAQRPKAATSNAFTYASADQPELPAIGDHAAWSMLPLKRYADFSGRSGRREFWMFQIIPAMIATLMFILLLGDGGAADVGAALMGCLALIALLVPQIALQVRRFHDQDKSGWFALLNFVPYLGPIIVLFFMLIEGTHGDNQYGPDPYNR